MSPNGKRMYLYTYVYEYTHDIHTYITYMHVHVYVIYVYENILIYINKYTPKNPDNLQLNVSSVPTR
jgi:hypothetical protein